MLSNPRLITSLKATTNYAQNMVSYLLSTDTTVNLQNYNAGLPCYISYGNKTFFGEWKTTTNGRETLYKNDPSFIGLSKGITTEAWSVSLWTSQKIDTTKYTIACARLWALIEEGGWCSFSSTESDAWSNIKQDGGATILCAQGKAQQWDNKTFSIKQGTYYFGMTVWSAAPENRGCVEWAYIY